MVGDLATQAERLQALSKLIADFHTEDIFLLHVCSNLHSQFFSEVSFLPFQQLEDFIVLYGEVSDTNAQICSSKECFLIIEMIPNVGVGI